MKLKVLSWNIWIDGNFEQVKELFERTQADIIGLQEVKADDPERNVIGYLTSHGYHHVFAPVQKEWDGHIFRDGPAIFSKLPIQSAEIFILSKENERAAVRINIETESGVLHVFSTHLLHTHQRQSDVQDEQVRTLLEIAPRTRTVIMGDFNATSESEPIRMVSEHFANTDLSNTPTWSNYKEGCGTCNVDSLDFRLDYIFASRDLKTSDAKVEHSMASDHEPISVDLDL